LGKVVQGLLNIFRKKEDSNRFDSFKTGSWTITWDNGEEPGYSRAWGNGIQVTHPPANAEWIISWEDDCDKPAIKIPETFFEL
jgi:hypothetical protein